MRRWSVGGRVLPLPLPRAGEDRQTSAQRAAPSTMAGNLATKARADPAQPWVETPGPAVPTWEEPLRARAVGAADRQRVAPMALRPPLRLAAQQPAAQRRNQLRRAAQGREP